MFETLEQIGGSLLDVDLNLNAASECGCAAGANELAGDRQRFRGREIETLNQQDRNGKDSERFKGESSCNSLPGLVDTLHLVM